MTSARVPSPFRQTRKDAEKQPSTIVAESADQMPSLELTPTSPHGIPKNTQIYEGTNQIQRMVMARQLLKG